jgi:hypothetical protein
MRCERCKRPLRPVMAHTVAGEGTHTRKVRVRYKCHACYHLQTAIKLETALEREERELWQEKRVEEL